MSRRVHEGGSTPLVRHSLSFNQIHRRSVEGFLWRPMPASIVENAGLVSLVAVSIESHRPAVLVTEVAQTTKVCRRVAQTFDVFLAGFAEQFRVIALGYVRFRIGVDVAEPSTEPDIDSIVSPRIVLLGMVQDALTNPGFDWGWDCFSPRLRIVNPHPSWHKYVLHVRSNAQDEERVCLRLLNPFDGPALA